MLTLASSAASGMGRLWAHPLVHGQSLQPQKKAEEASSCHTHGQDSESNGYAQLQTSTLTCLQQSPPAVPRETSATAVKIYSSSRYFKVLLEFLENRSLVSPWNYSPAAIFRSRRRACLQSCCHTNLWTPVKRATWLCVSFFSTEGFPGQFLHVVSGSR